MNFLIMGVPIPYISNVELLQYNSKSNVSIKHKFRGYTLNPTFFLSRSIYFKQTVFTEVL